MSPRHLNFKKLFQEWRAKEKLTQEKAASLLDIPVTTIRNWEQGRRRPNGLAEKTILKIILPKGHSFEIQTSTKEDAEGSTKP